MTIRHNHVAFRVAPSDHAPDNGEIEILIDGVDLRVLLQKIELSQPGAEDIAGKYAGLRAHPDVLPPSEHFLGTPGSHYDHRGKTQVLGRECGEPGCWPLVCVIEMRTNEIIWRDFEQPHRSGGIDHGPLWTYDGFGPFRFERRQYEAALASLPRADTH